MRITFIRPNFCDARSSDAEQSLAFDFKTNMRSLHRFGVYATYNPIFRKEVFKKHGMRFRLH